MWTVQTGPFPPFGSVDPTATWYAVLRWSGYLAAALLAYRVGSEPGGERASRVLRAFALVGAVYCAAAIAAGILGVNPLIDGVATKVEATRISGSFVNPNSFGWLAAAIALANLTLLTSEAAVGGAGVRRAIRSLIEAWPFLLGLAVAGLALLLSGSRGALIAFGAAAVAFLAFPLSRRDRDDRPSALRWIALAAALALVAVLVEVGGDKIGARFTGVDLEGARIAIYRAALAAIGDGPLFGVGLGAFETAFQSLVEPPFSNVRWDKAHSLYLEMLLEIGPLIGALWLVALGLIGWRLITAARQARGGPILRFALALYVLSALHSAVDFPLQMPANAMVFAILTGLALGRAGRILRR